MKTTEFTTRINAKSATDLVEGVITSITIIENFVEFNEYRLSGKIEIDKSLLLNQLRNMSLKKRKMLRNYLYFINKAVGLAVANKFLHFLMKKIMGNEVRYRIDQSEKYHIINEKRQAYYKAKEIYIAAQSAYLAEKGDYYKKRIAKGQKV